MKFYRYAICFLFLEFLLCFNLSYASELAYMEPKESLGLWLIKNKSGAIVYMKPAKLEYLSTPFFPDDITIENNLVFWSSHLFNRTVVNFSNLDQIQSAAQKGSCGKITAILLAGEKVEVSCFNRDLPLSFLSNDYYWGVKSVVGTAYTIRDTNRGSTKTQKTENSKFQLGREDFYSIKFIRGEEINNIISKLEDDTENNKIESAKEIVEKQQVQAQAQAQRAAKDRDVITDQRKVLEDQKKISADQKKKANEMSAVSLRVNLEVGSDTHCGMVIEIKKSIAKIQTSEGEKWLKLAQIYPAGSADCRFVNGVYQEVY